MPPQHPSHKKWIIPLAAVLLLAGFIYLGLRSAPQPTTIVPGEEVPVVEWPSEQVRREEMKDSSKEYEITAYYPVTKSEAITSIFRNFVNDQIAAFKGDIAAAGEMPEGFRAQVLDISYEEQKNDRADNYVFLVYIDTGGAHGISTTTTFSFTGTGERIALSQLFTNGARGLSSVADYVKKELLKSEFTNAEWVNDGAAPSEQNYRNFTVQPGGITFIFDPYQVAAYAAGIQKVTVPVSVFKTIANPELFK